MDYTQLEWRKSSKSGASGTCVEFADTPDGGMALRDSKAGPSGPILVFDRAEREAFIGGAKDGEFD